MVDGRIARSPSAVQFSVAENVQLRLPVTGVSEGVLEGRRQGMSEGVLNERALLRHQAARRFGVATGDALAALLANEEDVERLAGVGDLVVGCASAEELLRRGRVCSTAEASAPSWRRMARCVCAPTRQHQRRSCPQATEVAQTCGVEPLRFRTTPYSVRWP